MSDAPRPDAPLDDTPLDRPHADRPSATAGAGGGDGRAPLGHRLAGWPGLVGGAVAVMALRLWVVRDARFPRVVADEAAYLAMARLLGGGPEYHLGRASTYGPGYSFLIAPWFALDLSPDALFRAAVLTHVVTAAATFVVVERLARRLTHLGPAARIATAAVASSLPAFGVGSTLAWSDPVMPLVFCGAVLAVLRLVERPTAVRAVTAAAVFVAGTVFHNRLLPVVAVVLLVLVVLAVQRRLPVPAAGLAAAVTIVGLLVARAGTRAIHRRLYAPAGGVTAGFGSIDRVTDVSLVSIASAGELWYLLVTTAGLAGVGLGALALGWGRDLVAVARHRRRSDPPALHPVAGLRALDPVAATAVLAMMGLSFAASVIFISGGTRGDQIVYGRYNEMFLPVLVTCGIAALAAPMTVLARARTALLVGGATAATAALVWLTRLDQLKGRYTSFTIIGLFAIDPDGPQRMRFITAVALLLVAVVIAASALRPTRPVALLLVCALLVGLGTVRALDRLPGDKGDDPRHAADLAEILEPGDDLAYYGGVLSQFYRYQLYTPGIRARLVGEPPWESGQELVVAGTDQPPLDEAGYRLAWVDPESGAGLWVGPGPRQDALADDGDLLPDGLRGVTTAMEQSTVELADGVDVDGEGDGDDARATAVITRPEGEPWPGRDGAAPAGGRIRLGVVLEGVDCACVAYDGRADIGEWVPSEVERLEVPLEVPLDVEPGRYRLSVQLLREGEARFGTTATTTVTVAG